MNISEIQNILGVPLTGIVDELTSAGIRNYQLKHSLNVSGEADEELISHLQGSIMSQSPSNLSTDLMESPIPKMDLCQLPKSEYFQTETKKEYIFLHHTAGWNDPYQTIKNWADDTRGKIAVQYVIGGINIKTGDKKYDGTIVQSFTENGYARHLGDVDQYMHFHSIGIEICNFGWLVKQGSNYYTYTNTLVDAKQVCDLGYEFRGYRYWHRYSDAQIESVRMLVKYLASKHGVNVHIGLIDRLRTMDVKGAFDTYSDAKHGKIKGLLSHTSVRADKFDIFPQPEMVAMLKSL